MRGPEVQSRPLAAQLVPRVGCSGRVAAHAPPAQLRQQPRLRLRAPCDALLKSAEARIEKITRSSSGAPKGVEPLDVDEPKP